MQKVKMKKHIINTEDAPKPVGPYSQAVKAGDLIYCEFEELTTAKTVRGSRFRNSGIYMIADLCHYGDVGNSFTGLHLVRDSYGVKT